MTRAVLVAAPGSGSGKTTVTLGLLRALSRRQTAVSGAKSGPDYIDPRFHEAACGRPCPNLDAFSMPPAQTAALLQANTDPDGLVIVEGAMGLFDGAPPDGRGAAADLARRHGLPVILVIDCARMAQSVRALAMGFVTAEPEVRVVGLILNKIGSARHEAMLRRALDHPGVPPVIGALPANKQIAQPSRHLGLVQASELDGLEAFLDQAADLVEEHIDLAALDLLSNEISEAPAFALRPPAQRIALAQDAAFSFSYPHLLQGWRAAGAEVTPFSPLANEPVPPADLVYLPGGYPELYAARIAAAHRFINSLRNAAQSSDIYGECGGYMALGDALIDAQGHAHPMAGLLPLETSFATRKLHLGYRQVETAYGPFAGQWYAHEFHYATTLRSEGPALFSAYDAEGAQLTPMGLRQGRVCGSFAHLIAEAWT